MTSIRELKGDKVAVRDGVIGALRDVYFDDACWAVQFFLVEEGATQRLIPPETVEPGLSGKHKLRLGLTREQLDGVRVAEAAGRVRSGAELIGYAIQARDGPLGRVRDIGFDEDTWEVSEVLVDTRPWWPGGLVQVQPGDVEGIDWRERQLRVRLTRAQIKAG